MSCDKAECTEHLVHKYFPSAPTLTPQLPPMLNTCHPAKRISPCMDSNTSPISHTPASVVKGFPASHASHAYREANIRYHLGNARAGKPHCLERSIFQPLRHVKQRLESKTVLQAVPRCKPFRSQSDATNRFGRMGKR